MQERSAAKLRVYPTPTTSIVEADYRSISKSRNAKLGGARERENRKQTAARLHRVAAFAGETGAAGVVVDGFAGDPQAEAALCSC